MSTTVRVSSEAKKKFVEIRKKNPQCNTDAEVFDHILYVYEEQKFKPEPTPVIRTITRVVPSNVSHPIIDADQLQNKAFVQLGAVKKP